MAESTIDPLYVKQLEETVEVLKNGQVQYIKDLETTNEILTSHVEKDIRNGHWIDRHVDKDTRKSVIRSDLRVLGLALAYVVLKEGSWMAYHLHRVETKKFSGYEFGRLHGRRGYFDTIDEAKSAALRAIR